MEKWKIKKTRTVVQWQRGTVVSKNVGKKFECGGIIIPKKSNEGTIILKKIISKNSQSKAW